MSKAMGLKLTVTDNLSCEGIPMDGLLSRTIWLIMLIIILVIIGLNKFVSFPELWWCNGYNAREWKTQSIYAGQQNR